MEDSNKARNNTKYGTPIYQRGEFNFDRTCSVIKEILFLHIHLSHEYPCNPDYYTLKQYDIHHTYYRR